MYDSPQVLVSTTNPSYRLVGAVLVSTPFTILIAMNHH